MFEIRFFNKKLGTLSTKKGYHTARSAVWALAHNGFAVVANDVWENNDFFAKIWEVEE